MEFSASKIEDEGFTLTFTKSGAVKVGFNKSQLYVFE